VAHGLDVSDVPAALVAGFWLVAQVATSLADGVTRPGWSAGPAFVQVAAGIVSGAAAAFLLRRPERMRVEWWSR
jgi:protein-S-isoprenylcysteine O-methyltransferase Ste14